MHKVFIWGSGNNGKIIAQEGFLNNCLIYGYVETIKSVEFVDNIPVVTPQEVTEFDYIIVSVASNESIYSNCISIGWDLKKVLFWIPCKIENDSNKNLLIAKEILSTQSYSQICRNYGLVDENWIKEDAMIYSQLNKRATFAIDERMNFYCGLDKFDSAGSISSYFWQDLWAAKKIIRNRPKKHYDIGSRIDGFIAHLLSADINVNLIDIRPLDVNIDGISFTCADATNICEVPDESIESLSALCSIEHFGLGRYGDAIDPEACFKCFAAIQRKVKVGGKIYISLPIGWEHIEFNAHRVFFANTVISCFDRCRLLEFSTAKGKVFEENVDIRKYDEDVALGGKRFGLFYFEKI